MILTAPALCINGDPVVAAHQWQSLVGINAPGADELYALTVDQQHSGYLPDGVTWHTILNWTFPPSVVLTPGPGVVTLQGDVGIVGLFLQRSANALNMPNNSANVYATTNSAPPVDANWTTIATYSANPLPTTFTDTALPNPFFAYRLILILAETP